MTWRSIARCPCVHVPLCALGNHADPDMPSSPAIFWPSFSLHMRIRYPQLVLEIHGHSVHSREAARLPLLHAVVHDASPVNCPFQSCRGIHRMPWCSVSFLGCVAPLRGFLLGLWSRLRQFCYCFERLLGPRSRPLGARASTACVCLGVRLRGVLME